MKLGLNLRPLISFSMKGPVLTNLSQAQMDPFSAWRVKTVKKTINENNIQNFNCKLVMFELKSRLFTASSCSTTDLSIRQHQLWQRLVNTCAKENPVFFLPCCLAFLTLVHWAECFLNLICSLVTFEVFHDWIVSLFQANTSLPNAKE